MMQLEAVNFQLGLLTLPNTSQRPAKELHHHAVLAVSALASQLDIARGVVEHPQIGVIARVLRAGKQLDEEGVVEVATPLLELHPVGVVGRKVVLAGELAGNFQRENRLARSDELFGNRRHCFVPL